MRRSDAEKLAQETRSKEIKSSIAYIFFHSCAYFTVIVMFMLIVQAISESDAGNPQYIDPSRFLMFYPLSLSVAIANSLLKLKALKTAIKLLLHFAITSAAFYLFLCAPIKANASILLVFAVIYAIIASIILIIKKIISKKRSAPTTYSPMFSKDQVKK